MKIDERLVGGVTILDASDFAVIREIEIEYDIQRLIYSPDGQHILLGTFHGDGRIVEAPVDLRGLSAFARSTLEFVRTIRYGTTMSYQQVARAVGGPGHCRAVGQVLKSNPVPLVVPCHRVIRTDGQLGGFSAAGGGATKRRLLKLEGAL